METRITVAQRPPLVRRLADRAAQRLREHREPLLQVVKSAFAAGVAWEIARRATGTPQPIFAALAALLTVQITVYESLTQGLQRVLGVVAGVVLAFYLGRALGLHSWSIGLVMFSALVAGRLLRLSPAGAIQVPISALVVMAIGATSSGVAVGRVADTAIGAAVAVLVNVAVVPPTHLGRAAAALRHATESIAKVLGDMGEGVRGGTWTTGADRWLSRARELDGALRSAREAVERGAESVRWNPAGRVGRSRIPGYREAVKSVERIWLQTRSIARALLDAASSPPEARPRFPDPVRGAVGDLLTGAAEAVRLLGEALDDRGEATPRALRRALQRAHADRLALLGAVHLHARDDAPGAWAVYGSLALDGMRLLEDVEAGSGTWRA